MPCPLLAALPAHPEMSDAAVFMTNGLFVVIGALLVLSIVISAISLLFKHGEKAVKNRADSRTATNPIASPVAASAGTPASSAAPVAKPAAAPESAPLPEHIAAILAAAVHVALEGQAHRILHIEPSSGGWAREGRREIFSSHRFR